MNVVDAVTADGVRLRLARTPAIGPRRAVALCGHAMMTDGRYFKRLAGHLATRGIETFVVDWRGHGASTPPDPHHDDWSFDDLVELDLPAALAAIAGATGESVRDVAIVGHSLGGLVTLAALGTGVIAPPRRLILAATSVWLAGPRGDRRRRLVMKAASAIAERVGWMPIRAIRMGSADEPRGYAMQLAGWVTSGRWTSRTGVDYLARLPSIDVAAWAFAGSADWMCRPRDADVLVRRLRGAPPLERIGRSTGYAIDADHFTLFTRPELEPLWDRIADRILDNPDR